MRYIHTAFVCVTLIAAPALAQQRWQPEVGVQFGYSHVKLAGTNADDAITVIGIPEGNYIPALLTTASLFATIPAGKRIAIEPQFTATQVNATLTAARIGARLDYAISGGLYAAAGGVLNYLSTGNPGHNQVGLQVAVGYRGPLTGTLNGRVEANWLSTHNSDLLPPFNAYSVFAGISSLLVPRTARPARRTATGPWSPAVGVTGGYVSAHGVGSGSFGGIFFPGGTNDLTSLGILAPGPPTLFAVFPLGGRWAVEPSFDLRRTSGQIGTGITAMTAGLRADYALHGGWYAAAGAQLAYINPSTGPSGSILGATLATGYRFHLAANLGSRCEASYTLSAKNSDLGSPPVNTLALLLGVTMPLR